MKVSIILMLVLDGKIAEAKANNNNHLSSSASIVFVHPNSKAKTDINYLKYYSKIWSQIGELFLKRIRKKRSKALVNVRSPANSFTKSGVCKIWADQMCQDTFKTRGRDTYERCFDTYFQLCLSNSNLPPWI